MDLGSCGSTSNCELDTWAELWLLLFFSTVWVHIQPLGRILYTSRCWAFFDILKNCRQISATPRRSIFHAAKSSQIGLYWVLCPANEKQTTLKLLGMSFTYLDDDLIVIEVANAELGGALTGQSVRLLDSGSFLKIIRV